MAQCLNQPIVLRTEFFELDGINTHTECLVLSQLIYWASKVEFKEFYKTDKELASELKMNVFSFRRIKKKLEGLPFIITTVRGAPSRVLSHLLERVNKRRNSGRFWT